MGCAGSSLELRNLPRLDGKTVIVTGANAGIGKATAAFFCSKGAHVVMVCRDMWKGEAAAQEIRRQLGKDEENSKRKKDEGPGDLVVKRMDLSILSSVRQCATQILQEEQRIDILVNNAGVMMCPYSLSEDGFELQFATNHLGHFLFTLLLLPRIIRSAPSRIINLSSVAHKWCNSMNFDDINMKNNYTPAAAYFRSKAANILFTKELARRLKDSGVTVYAVHPGIVDTAIWKYSDQGIVRGTRWFMTHVAPAFIKSPQQGSQTTIYCAMEPKLANQSGLYYSDCKVKTPTSFVQNEDLASKLFMVSLEMVGLQTENTTESDNMLTDV